MNQNRLFLKEIKIRKFITTFWGHGVKLSIRLESRALSWADNGDDLILSSKWWWEGHYIRICLGVSGAHLAVQQCSGTLCHTLRWQFIYPKINHFSLPSWVPDKLLFLLALSHTLMGKDTVQVLATCHDLLRSPAPGQNHMRNISNSTIRNYKALPGRPHGE